MFAALSFIGELPEYALLAAEQLRCFYDESICFIRNDTSRDEEMKRLDILPVNYDYVADNDFIACANDNLEKWANLPSLGNRKELFLRSFERFFLLKNFMKKCNLEDCLFIELDNLIYDDPRKWIDRFSEKPLALTIDAADRVATGVCYVKNWEALSKLTDFHMSYINSFEGHVCEMEANAEFLISHPDDCQILPTFWDENRYLPEMSEGFEKYNRSVFDSSGMGIYLTGPDTIHTKGEIIPGYKSQWCMIDYTEYEYVRKADSEGRMCYHVKHGNELIKINSLHAHSKNLRPYMSNTP